MRCETPRRDLMSDISRTYASRVGGPSDPARFMSPGLKPGAPEANVMQKGVDFTEAYLSRLSDWHFDEQLARSYGGVARRMGIASVVLDISFSDQATDVRDLASKVGSEVVVDYISGLAGVAAGTAVMGLTRNPYAAAAAGGLTATVADIGLEYAGERLKEAAADLDREAMEGSAELEWNIWSLYGVGKYY
jgi:hypothetical protein